DIDFVRSVAPLDIGDPNATDGLQRLLAAIPAHMVGVRPVIQLDGVVAASGSRVGMGEAQTLNVRFSAPTISTADSTLEMAAWGRYGITVDYSDISQSMINAKSGKLQLLAQQYQAANGQGLS